MLFHLYTVVRSMSEADVTKRDQCWAALIDTLYRTRRDQYDSKGNRIEDGFKLEDVYERYDLEDENISYATLRRTAKAMQALEFLKRDSEKAKTWLRGPRANIQLADTRVDLNFVLEQMDLSEEEFYNQVDEEGFV